MASMFTNPYDAQIAQQEASQDRALAASKVPWYQRGAYEGTKIGEEFGRNLGGMMGMQTPEDAKQAKIQEIMGQYGEGAKTEAQLKDIAGDFGNAGMMDLMQETLNMIDKTYGTNKDSRGAAQKSIEYFAEINQCSTLPSGSAEYTKCMRTSIQDAEDYKRVGEVEFGNKQGIKNFQTAVGDSLKNQTHIRKQISTLKNLKRLAPQIYTGLGQSGVAAWNKVGTILGFGKATNAQAATEAFRSNGLEIAMGFIHNTKGAVSDMEMAKFIEASPNLHNTEKGNLLIINFAIAQQDLEKKLNVEMNRFSRSNRSATMADWNFHADSFLNRPENSISNQLQKDFDDAFSDPAYGGGTGVDTDTGTDASQDIQSQIDALR